MKMYLAIFQQDGGCDYSIGCGIKTIKIEAENAVDAALKIKEIVRESYTGEQALSLLEYYEVVAAFEADLKRWYAEFEHEQQNAEQKAIREKELAELERLKKKYNQ